MNNVKEKLEKLENLHIEHWIDVNGKKTKPIHFSDYNEKFKVIFGFQHWCPGCHSAGFPSLKKMVEALHTKENISFFAIQTVFEGHSENTFEKLVETQKKYDLQIPFAHDAGDATSNNRSKLMQEFQTGGTPWFLLINEKNQIIFNDFHLNTESAIDYLKGI